MMAGMKPFYAVLVVLALVSLALALPYLFPPQSVQECNKILAEYSGYSQPYSYGDCIMYVAAIKGDRGLCQHISSSSDRSTCIATIGKVARGENISYKYETMDDVEDEKCGTGYYSNEHICRAIGYAKKGF